MFLYQAPTAYWGPEPANQLLVSRPLVRRQNRWRSSNFRGNVWSALRYPKGRWLSKTTYRYKSVAFKIHQDVGFSSTPYTGRKYSLTGDRTRATSCCMSPKLEPRELWVGTQILVTQTAEKCCYLVWKCTLKISRMNEQNIISVEMGYLYF